MRSAIAISIAALAGSALAAPSYGGYPVDNVHVDVVVETVLHTVYVTEGQPQPTSTSCSESTSTPVYTPPPKPPVGYQAVKPKPTPTPTPTPTPDYYVPAPSPPPVKPSPTPEPAPAPSPSPSPSPAPQAPSTDDGYMGTVAKWRSKLGLKELQFSDKLQSNAHKVVVDGAGQMKHELNEGTYGQVLAPGQPDEFEKVFVGGWLCEIPTLAGLDGVCTTFSAGWSYEGQTGHAEILTNPQYSQIGCANLEGIWCCDLA